MIYDSVNKEWSGLSLPGVLNPEASVGQIILNLLDRTPEKVADISADSGEKMTCKELRERIVRVAQNLIKMGYKKGDMIGIMLRNEANLSPLVIGAMTIGMPMNGFDPSFDVDDTAHILNVSKPVLLFCEEGNLEIAKKACEKVNLSPKIVVYGVGTDKFLEPTGIEHTFVAPNLGDAKEVIAFIPCSSGTTGPSKGICLSHAQLIEQNSSQINPGLGSALYFSSLYWITSITLMIKCYFDGITRVTTTKGFSADIAFDIIEKYKISYILTPGRYLAELAHSARIKTTDLSSLRGVFSGGNIMSDDLRAQVEKYLPNGKVVNSYGMSELGGSATSDFFGKRPGSCGMLLPNFKAKVIDDEGNSLGPGEKGEILMKNSFPFLGYYNNKEATDNSYKDGWLHTGDIGYFDEDKFFYINDRKKEVFKYMGYQIFPGELEAILEKHEGVNIACVTYIHDPVVITDLPTAVVVKKPGSTATAAEILEFANNLITSNYKKIRGGLYIVDELPKTSSGKTIRRLVKEIAISEFRKRKQGE